MDNTVLLSLLRNAIELVGFSVLFLMLDQPRFSWKKTILGYSLYTLVYLVVSTAWVIIDIYSFGKFITLSIFVGALIIFPLFSANNPFQVFYNLSLQIFILIMQIVVSIGAALAFFGGNPWADVVLRIIYLGIVVFCYFRWLRKPFQEISDIGVKNWLPMSIISVLGNLFVIYYWTRPDFLMYRGFHEQMIFICIWSLLFVTHLIMIQSLTRMKHEIMAKGEREMAAITTRLLTRQLELLDESVQEARRIRHDVRHHDMVIAEYVEKGEFDALLRYLGQYEKEAQRHAAVILCDNLAANNILSAYIRKAKQQDIEVRLDVALDQEIAVSDQDLVVMLANIMENAIRGCIHSGKENPFIALHIGRKASKLVIYACNTAGEDVLFENGLPRAKDGEGIGVSSILHSAAGYGGEHHFELKDGVFSCQLLLNLEA
ncbi:GHKL domain-containing protein [Eubacterium barkeri]|uniref:GHKL domain-containing protein n=1 Tax=Eubacterium barkeri TaxID=1528 RepID=UPI0015A0E1AD|nr:GHKL domain-containing protein [Eubacterium barkeri]